MTVPALTEPAAILLDWDNTLVDTWPTIRDAMNHTLVRFGQKPWSMQEIRTRVRKSMRDSFPDLFGDAWPDAADVYYDRYQSIHVDRIAALPGAQDLLSYLHGRGLFSAIVSNKAGHYLRIEADHLGWSRYLGNLVGAGDAKRDKPAPDPVLMALDGSTLRPQDNVWFAGDADIDLECAVNAGCIPVLVRENAPDSAEMTGLPPHHYAENCTHLKRMIQQASGSLDSFRGFVVS